MLTHQTRLTFTPVKRKDNDGDTDDFEPPPVPRRTPAEMKKEQAKQREKEKASLDDLSDPDEKIRQQKAEREAMRRAEKEKKEAITKMAKQCA